MTPNNQNIDVTGFRRQLSSYWRFLDDEETKKKTRKLLLLTQIKLQTVKFLHEKGKAKTKDIEAHIHCSRSTTLKYCKELEEEGIVHRDTKKLENSALKPTFIFYIDEEISNILSAIQKQEDELSHDHELSPVDINDNDEINLDSPSNSAFENNDIADIVNQISLLPPIAKQILELIKTSGVTAKSASEDINCASTTTNKYLKYFVDLGWATRNKDETANGEYIYYSTEDLSCALDHCPPQVQYKTSEENSMESINISDESIGQKPYSGFAFKLKQWIDLNRQLREIEKYLIDQEGQDAVELLADLRKKDF